MPYRAVNRYPPSVAVLIGLPLSMFTPWHAYLVWVAIMELLLAGALLLIFLRLRLTPVALLAAAPWLLSSAIFWELRLGQVNLVVAAGSLLLMLLLERKADWGSGIVWGLITAIKLIPLLYLPLLLRKRLWPVTLIISGLLAAMCAGYFLIHPEDLSLFSQWVVNPTSFKGVGFQTALANLSGSSLLPRVCAVPFVVIAALLTLRRRRVSGEVMALWIATYFLIYNRIWIHHYILLFAGVALALRGRGRAHLLIPLFLAALPERLGSPSSPVAAWSGDPAHAVAALWLFGASAWHLLQEEAPDRVLEEGPGAASRALDQRWPQE